MLVFPPRGQGALQGLGSTGLKEVYRASGMPACLNLVLLLQLLRTPFNIFSLSRRALYMRSAAGSFSSTDELFLPDSTSS